MRRGLLRLGLMAVAGLLALPCSTLGAPHTTSIPAATAKVGVDGSVQLRIRFDLLAFVLDESPADVSDDDMNALLDGPPEALDEVLKSAKERMLRQTEVRGGEIRSVTFPTADDVREWAQTNGATRLPVMMTSVVAARLPAGQRRFSARFPKVMGSVILTTELPYQEPVSEPVAPGELSSELAIPTQQQVDRAAAAIVHKEPPKAPQQAAAKKSDSAKAAPREIKPEPPDKETPKPRTSEPPLSVKTEPPISLAETPDPAAETPLEQGPGPVAALAQYVRMGFTHILPKGLDHILFVLGLFLLSTRWKDLLKQVSAFTLAHSLTLGLSLYGVVRLPSSVVEPIIALSIVFVAVENLVTKEMRAWRPYVVFGFGLVHGLGFAGALADAGLRGGGLLSALVGFNVGVELGQLAVIAAAFCLVGWLRSSQHYRARVTLPGSLAIAFIAIVWTIERL